MASNLSAQNKRQLKCLKYKLSVILTPSSEIWAAFPYNKPSGCVLFQPDATIFRVLASTFELGAERD